jgi:hypothetical protein
MAAAGAGQLAELERRLGGLRKRRRGRYSAPRAAHSRRSRARDYASVVALLEPVTGEFNRMGGSGAQREVLFKTLEAARARLAAG